MPRPYLITATFEHVSGFPQDRIVNTFPVWWDAIGEPSGADLVDAMSRVQQFYTSVQTTEAVGAYLSDEISRTSDSAVTRVYDLDGHLDGSAHGSPVTTDPFSPPAAGGSYNLPGEVAVTLTTRALNWSSALVEAPDGGDTGTALDRPRQRLSGRIYLGPLRNSAVAGGGGVVRVSTFLITDLLDAAEEMADGLATDGWTWSVWSRANEDFEPIVAAQVDNAFDTQRRRGPDATTRTTRTF